MKVRLLSRWSPVALSVLASLALTLGRARPAQAQFAGQPPGRFGPGGGMPGGQPPMNDEREEGPAEAAPDEDERPSDLEPLGAYPGQHRRRTQIIELDGYLRLRTDFMHKFFLGQGYVNQPGNVGTPPFPTPLECGVQEGECGSKNLGSGNLRLRLEPTINVTDQVRVMSQIDILDNTIMGSTPDSLVSGAQPTQRAGGAPASSLATTQYPPEVGRNSLVSSVRAKRAWAEVDTEFGSLRFGRMPWHFGRGLYFNNGACPDCDGGTTVDRLMGITQIYGHQVALSWDFGPQGYNAGMTELGLRDPEGLPLDLSQRDDVLQVMAAITRIDDERRLQERVGRGDVVFNYGAQLVFRQQSHETFDNSKIDTSVAPMQMPMALPNRETVAKSLTLNVEALVVVPSLWMKLAWKALTLEFESTAVVGRLENAGPLSDPAGAHLAIQQLGWVLASELRLYSNAFFLGFETGGATGDQAENPRTYLNYRWKTVTQPPGDRKITDFKFSPEYHVDEILFHRIVGTVTNAIYAKPTLTYWMNMAETRQLGVSASFIYSMAQVPVSTPGNSLSYGLEMNLGLNYRNPADGVYGGFVWGVLWPMSALNRPGPTASGSLWPKGEDASSAQILRLFFGVRF